MKSKKRKEDNLSLSEALQALNAICDSEGEEVVNLPLPEAGLSKPIAGRVKKVAGEPKELSVERIRGIFQTIFNYIQQVYETEPGKDSERIQDVKSIMILVGEAAEKLDHYTSLFKNKEEKKITQLKEYKRLKDLYNRKVEKKVDEGLLSKWIFGLVKAGPSKKALRKARARKKEKSQHVFVDLEMVKKDTEYELLLMRKEDGSRFYSPRLLRNLKLVCEFGGQTGAHEDIFAKVYDWRDTVCHVAAMNMLHRLNLPLKRFYQEAFRYKKQEGVAALNKAIMSLMLAANPKNLRANSGYGEGKSSLDYFSDFQSYLREALNTRYYQKLLAYPPKTKDILANAFLSTALNLCRALFLHTHIMQELFHHVHEILDEAKKFLPEPSLAPHERGIFLWSRLAYDYAEITKSFQKHANGPLKRIFESLEEGRHSAFDSIQQFNLPHTWFAIFLGKERLVHLRMASPTRQVLVNKAAVLDEFKGFLLSKSQRGSAASHLLINLQDRTSWREFSRCQVLEQLQNSSPFKEHLNVITLPTDTLFYHQSGPYEMQDDTQDFIQGFKEQLQSASSGYYFPPEIKKKLMSEFVPRALSSIHEFFFNNEKYLSTKDRQNFILLFHLFLELKLIDIFRPSTFSLSCKDAIDIGVGASVLLFSFYKLLEKEEISEEEKDFIEAMIYGPSIFIRERGILSEPLNRILSSLQVLEAKREALGFKKYQKDLHQTFDSLFERDILQGKSDISLLDIQRQVSEAA